MELLEQATLWLAVAIELGAAMIIGLAAIQALVRALPLFAGRRDDHDRLDTVRLRLGRWLTLGLEFALAADVLKTAVTPSWTEIGQLAAIAVLRTALNYFLQREIDAVEARRREATPPGAAVVDTAG